jgi:hypothetical protein
MLGIGMPSSQLMLPWKHATVVRNVTETEYGGTALRYISLKLTAFEYVGVKCNAMQTQLFDVSAITISLGLIDCRYE